MKGVPNLVQVEVRKVVDTRAGRGLIALSVITMTSLAAAAALSQRGSVVSAAEVKMAALGPVSLIAPLIAIMIFAGEWTTRNAVHAFVLEPRRHRVIAAKFCAAITLAICIVLLGALISVVATAIVAASAGVDVSLQAVRLSGGGIFSDLARVALYTVLGMAIGSIVASTAVAVTAFLAVTLLADPLIRFASPMVHQWISLDPAIIAVSNLEFTAATPLQAFAGITAWLLLPGLAGFLFYRLREAK